MEPKRTGQSVVDKIKKSNQGMEDLHTKLKDQYDQENNLDPNREMPKNTFKTDNKMKIKELINKIVQEELSLMEKKKKKEEDVDIDLDLDTEEADDAVAADTAELDAADTAVADDTMSADMDLSAGGTGDAKEIGKHLQSALEAAKNLPASETKDKLIRQIGNTALFFLKTQIPASGDQI